jgi:hypothetical protein
VAAVASSSSGGGGGGGSVTAGAIASALDHSPGLSGGIRTSVRASDAATDDALITEQAVREAIASSVQVDFGDDGTANIDPLRQISVVGDTNGIFSTGDESGELAVDAGKKWPDADQLDGVEGSNYARTDISETFNNKITVPGIQISTDTVAPLISNKRSTSNEAVTVQPTGGDRPGSVELFPSGTENRSHFIATNEPDPNNWHGVEFEVQGSESWFRAISKGTPSNAAITNFNFEDFDYVKVEDGTSLRAVEDLIVGANTSPNQPLQVNHAGDNQLAARIGDKDTVTSNTGIYLRSNGEATIRSGAKGTLGLYIGPTGSTGVTIANNGNVGIGDPPPISPSYALDAAGDIRTQGTFRGTELRDDSGYVEGLFGEGFVLKDQRNSNGRSYMELDDMRVRGQLRAHIFQKDIVRASNSLLYVSDAAQTTEDVTTPISTGSTFTLFVDTNVFQAGEEITFKDSSGGGITEVVGTVSNVVGSTTRGGQTVYEVSVTLNFGTSATIPGGSTVVRTSGARMLLDASTADAPVQTLWNQSGNRRGAFGNLDGQYDFTAATFGMAAGDPNGSHITAEAGQGVRLRDGNSTLAQLNGTQLALGTSDQIVFDPTAGIEAQIKGTLRVSSGNIEAIDGSNEYRLNPAEPAEKFYQGGDLVAVFTSETNPSYGPTKTSDFFDSSPSTPEFYTLSGGVFGGFAIVVRNADPNSSELVGWKAVDDDTGQTITSRTTTVSPSSTTTLSDTAKVDGVSTVRIEEAGSSSALIEEIDFEAFKPLTVISRRGVRVYKTSGTFDEL